MPAFCWRNGILDKARKVRAHKNALFFHRTFKYVTVCPRGELTQSAPIAVLRFPRDPGR